MNKTAITLIGFVATLVGAVISIKSDYITALYVFASGLVLTVVGWGIWISLKVSRISKQLENSKNSKAVKAPPLPTKSIPDKPHFNGFESEPIKIDHQNKKVKTPPVFLQWERFTILFWVEITEEFFNSHNNRYLFSYTSNLADKSDYPNAFFLGIEAKSAEWRFIINGDDAQNTTRISFRSAHNLLGWRLFAVRWHKGSRKLSFSIDAGHVHSENREIPASHFPLALPNLQFNVGGWQDNWHGGLSELRFYNFRIFQRFLTDPDLETVLSKERASVESF
jgi:hypothetical protein